MNTTRQRSASAWGLILAGGISACSMPAEPPASGSLGEPARTTEALTCGVACNTPNYNATSAAPTCTPLPCATPTCWQRFSGGFLWPDGQIPYQIQTSYTKTYPDGGTATFTFSASDISNIQTAANDWSSKTQQVVHFFRCDTAGTCGQFFRKVTIRPEDGDTGSPGSRAGGTSGDGWVTLAPGSALSAMAHEIGHAIGFDHTFNRADRDRFEKFSESGFCHPPSNLDFLFTAKAPGAGDKGFDPLFPSIPTASFGAYDETSVMNYLSADICETVNNCDPSGSDLATPGDGSAAIELYRAGNEWAPFNSLGKDVGRCTTLDYTLASNVTMVGSPALASFGFPHLIVFVRGSDGHIYQKTKLVPNGTTFLGWSEWSDMGGGFNSDPAAVSWEAGHIDLFARQSDGNLYQRTLTLGGWGAWASVSKPGAGIGSAPAVSSWGPNRLDVFVRGSSDSRLYQKTFSGSPAAWGSWMPVGMATFQGKPAAVARTTNDILVATRASNNMLTVRVFNGSWQVATSLGVAMDADASPGLASWSASRADIFYKFQGILFQESFTNVWRAPIPLGGLISSVNGSGDPAAVATSTPFKRIDVMAPVNDHGARGVWWKYYPFARSCTAASGCGACGADDPNACHRAADFYGIVAGQTFGFAPAEVRDWWSNVAHCNVSASSSTTTLCQNAANLYAMATGSFNGAPADAQSWWNQQGCTATPICQGLSDLYGIQANVTWEYAPTAVQTWWTGHSCLTFPALPTDACQRAADEFAITGNVTFGFAPSTVQTWWTAQSCNAAAHF